MNAIFAGFAAWLAGLLGTDAVTLGFDIGCFFQTLGDKSKEWARWFIVFLGVVLIVWGIVNIVKAFISQGRGQTNWLMTIAMILVGGFLCAIQGFDEILDFTNIGAETIKQMGESGGT